MVFGIHENFLHDLIFIEKNFTKESDFIKFYYPIKITYSLSWPKNLN